MNSTPNADSKQDEGFNRPGHLLESKWAIIQDFFDRARCKQITYFEVIDPKNNSKPYSVLNQKEISDEQDEDFDTTRYLEVLSLLQEFLIAAQCKIGSFLENIDIPKDKPYLSTDQKIERIIKEFNLDPDNTEISDQAGGSFFKKKLIDDSGKYILFKLPEERAENLINAYPILKEISKVPEHLECEDGELFFDSCGVKKFIEGKDLQALTVEYFNSKEFHDHFTGEKECSFDDYVKNKFGLEELIIDQSIKDKDYHSLIFAQAGLELGKIFDKTKKKLEHGKMPLDYPVTLSKRMKRIYGDSASFIHNYIITNTSIREVYEGLQMCDVKPDNFLISNDGQVFIIDLDGFKTTDGLTDLLASRRFLTLNNAGINLLRRHLPEEYLFTLFKYAELNQLNNSLTKAQGNCILNSPEPVSDKFFWGISNFFNGFVYRNNVLDTINQGIAPPDINDSSFRLNNSDIFIEEIIDQSSKKFIQDIKQGDHFSASLDACSPWLKLESDSDTYLILQDNAFISKQVLMNKDSISDPIISKVFSGYELFDYSEFRYQSYKNALKEKLFYSNSD